MMRGTRLCCACVLLALLAAGCKHTETQRAEQPAAVSTAAKFVKTELYFGLSKPDGSTVSAAQWQAFVDKHITPAFKEGLTVIDAGGQYLNAAGAVIHEGSKLVILIHEPTPTARAALTEIIREYKRQFQQESVLRTRSLLDVSFE